MHLSPLANNCPSEQSPWISSRSMYLFFDSEKINQWVAATIRTAKTLIDKNKKQQLKFGLVHLKEAQRVLEYAANSGKAIQRGTIIAVLHNQAAIYQKLWELQHCSSYLQAIIYNYDNFIRQASVPGSVLVPTDPSRLRMKQRLARYNLQFCAVNSQLAEHDNALSAVRRAYGLMSECVQGSLDEIGEHLIRSDGGRQSLQLKLELLSGICKFQNIF